MPNQKYSFNRVNSLLFLADAQVRRKKKQTPESLCSVWHTHHWRPLWFSCLVEHPPGPGEHSRNSRWSRMCVCHNRLIGSSMAVAIKPQPSNKRGLQIRDGGSGRSVGIIEGAVHNKGRGAYHDWVHISRWETFLDRTMRTPSGPECSRDFYADAHLLERPCLISFPFLHI